MSLNKTAAFLVHLLTASGVLCTLPALMAVSGLDPARAFWWLGLALFIDAIDGPLARAVGTTIYVPRFSGERLDLIIDYLNYVVLPVFILVRLPLISGTPGLVAGGLILMTSLYHFSDTQSKTADGYFIGFPAIWNVVVFYLLAFQVTGLAALVIVAGLSGLTFVPFRWLHPVRVVRLRWLTILVAALWLFGCGLTLWKEFSIGLVEQLILVGSLAYIVALSLLRSFEAP